MTYYLLFAMRLATRQVIFRRARKLAFLHAAAAREFGKAALRSCHRTRKFLLCCPPRRFCYPAKAEPSEPSPCPSGRKVLFGRPGPTREQSLAPRLCRTVFVFRDITKTCKNDLDIPRLIHFSGQVKKSVQLLQMAFTAAGHICPPRDGDARVTRIEYGLYVKMIQAETDKDQR